MLPNFHPPEERVHAWRLFALPLLALLIVLSQASRHRSSPSWHVAWPGGPQPAGERKGTDAALLDPRELPDEVADYPELVDERTAHSATFHMAEDDYRTVLSSRPLHYLDQRGAWQVINPLFQQTEENFIVTENSLRSRAGLRRAWLSTGVEDAAIYWQAEALYAGNRRLAEALAEADVPARPLDGGYTLHYANSWSDPALAEELLGRPMSELVPVTEYEETKKHLTNASLWGSTDELDGVVENLVVGQAVPTGTGKIDLKAGFQDE
jgi:hypothetical protein